MSGFHSRSVATVYSSVRPYKVGDAAMKPLPAMTLKTGCTPLTLHCCRKPRCLARLPLKQMANSIFCTRVTSWTKDHMLLGKVLACGASLKIPYSLQSTFSEAPARVTYVFCLRRVRQWCRDNAYIADFAVICRPNGSTLFRNAVLEKQGWHVVSVPWFDWDNLRTKPDKVAYLETKIRQAVSQHSLGLQHQTC